MGYAILHESASHCSPDRPQDTGMVAKNIKENHSDTVQTYAVDLVSRIEVRRTRLHQVQYSVLTLVGRCADWLVPVAHSRLAELHINYSACLRPDEAPPGRQLRRRLSLSPAHD